MALKLIRLKWHLVTLAFNIAVITWQLCNDAWQELHNTNKCLSQELYEQFNNFENWYYGITVFFPKVFRMTRFEGHGVVLRLTFGGCICVHV